MPEGVNNHAQHMARQDTIDRPRIVVVGAGISGLAVSLRLAAAGLRVTLVERHDWTGGKIRTVASPAGPIDAGPTVLTMRHVFDDLFAVAGARLDDHVSLIPQEIIARHFWPDGSQLDLFHDPGRSADAIGKLSGSRSARQFLRFCARSKALYEAFDAPMMRAAEPSFAQLAATVMTRPALLPAMAPLRTLNQALRRWFDDPRLVQLFGRYATYVGGSPAHAPALLSLIWHAEASGVWVVKGGMHKLAQAITRLAVDLGVELVTGQHVDRIAVEDGRATAVHLENGRRLVCAGVVHTGDPRALATGALGADVGQVAAATKDAPRSFSARVHSFAAKPKGCALAHHNIFFDADPLSEFSDLMAGRVPTQPSIYLCALDRGQGGTLPDLERYEIITNAPATMEPDQQEELDTWHPQIMQKMAQFGMSFSPTPGPQTVTTPRQFHVMFPASLGALYGQTPHGMTASLQRPRARTSIPNLWLAGGGTHPGAGVPMATLSAQHAAAAILGDQTLMSTLAPMAMPGGMSTG